MLCGFISIVDHKITSISWQYVYAWNKQCLPSNRRISLGKQLRAMKLMQQMQETKTGSKMKNSAKIHNIFSVS